MDTDVICKSLQSLERSERQNALKDLLKFCENESTASEDLISIYDQCYLHILKCYSDRFESCRELACTVVTEFMKKLPKNDYYLQYVVSTIASRIGQKEMQEHSEEIRLVFVRQLNFLIDKFRSSKESDPLLKSYNEIIDTFLKTLTDSYPIVQRETCNCIKLLAAATPSFHYRAETLTKPLYPILLHKHSANRVAAIETLGIICLHILTNSDCIVRIITEISPLVMDSMPLVRKECGKVGCMWLLELKDRYSFFDRILPIVLCCLGDDSPEVRGDIEALWLKCGEQYFEENQTELDKLEWIDKTPENYPENVNRPTLGCRALVQRSLRIVKSIMWETSDWKEEVRLHSLKLLWQIVVHAEQALSTKFFEIFPDLCRTCEDSDQSVVKMAIKVAELMGRLMIFDDWFEFALEHLEQKPKLGCLRCFYFIYLGSKNIDEKYILAIAKLIAKRDFANSLKAEIQIVLLKFVEILWERYQQQKHENKVKEESLEKAMEEMNIENDEVEKYIYHTLIKVIAISFTETDSDNEIQQQGKILLKKLARNDENLIPELHETHLNSVIKTFDSLDFELDEFSEPIILLHGTIRICGFRKSYLESLKSCIQTVWEYAVADGKIKIFTAISIAMLTWNETMSNVETTEDNVKILDDFVKTIVEPHLIWKPGASAESMRSMATATLCSMSQGAAKASTEILPQFASYFQNLIEDNSVATRIYALRCFMNFGSMKFENLKPIAYAILQRLDDPSAEVRLWAARVLSKFDTSQIKDNELNGWYTFIRQALKMLFLHFDGPEIKLKKAIKDTITAMGKQYPNIFDEIYAKAYAMCANKDELSEIEQNVKA